MHNFRAHFDKKREALKSGERKESKRYSEESCDEYNIVKQVTFGKNGE